MSSNFVDDRIAYRVLEGRCHEVPAAPTKGAELQLREEVLIAPGPYRIQGRDYDVSAPGVYRFQPAGKIGRQFAVLPDTIPGIASVTAELVALGNADRNKPWPIQSRIATRRRLLLHCVQISNLAVFLASQVGLQGRTWLMWNYAARDAGLPLSSHAITEITSSEGTETRLYDLSFGVELTTTPGSTDFASYQAALLSDEPVTHRRISQAFGFEYGSRFFNPHTEDFDGDLLAASDEALIEAHRRIAGGEYVIGQDLAGQKFVTALTRGIVDALPEGRVPAAKREEMAAATLIPSPEIDPIEERSSGFKRDELVGYRIAGGALSPLSVTTGGDPVEIRERDEVGIRLSSGAVWNVAGVPLDLTSEGLFRFRKSMGGPALQGVVAQRDAFRFAVHLLEACAHGTLHDDMTPDDLRLAARTAKVAAQADTVLDLIRSLFALVRIPYRCWRLPTDLAIGQGGYPVPVWLTLLELADGSGQRHLIDTARALDLTGPGDFAELEASGSAAFEPICRTPRFSYGGTDAKTGLTTDLMAPLWLGDAEFATSLWQETLKTYPALAEDAQGRRLTTAASKEKARALLSGNEALKPFLIDVLDAPEA